jgi:hypothetical protein
MDMVDENKNAVPLCSGTEDIRHQVPSGKFGYKYKDHIEKLLDLGEYLPFHMVYKSSEFMLKLSTYKYVYKNPKGFLEILNRITDYLNTWENCVKAHEKQKGTFCYSKEFRALMTGSFENIRSGITDLALYSHQDFEDFNKCLEFAGYWNNIQQTISETYYAHLVGYPKWLNIKNKDRKTRPNCAECKVMNIIGPPPLSLIGLSACFMPYVTHLPDGTAVPEGIIVNEKASPIHLLHEHVHGYLHEKKATGRKHLHCEWIDEGIADWAAVKILQPDIKEKSYFLEMYDFWIILNSIDKNDCRRIVKLWCNEPEKFKWQEFVKDAIVCIRKYRFNNREKLAWFGNEQCQIDMNLDTYFK